MSVSSRRHEIDMCNGPLFWKIVQFALPLVLTGIMQLLYNAADVIVVGRFAGETALAAVGSTSSLINLIVNLFMGMSSGSNVAIAHRYGAGNVSGVKDVLHTSVALSLISGIVVAVFGFTMAHPLLMMMGSPEDVIDQATLYLKIYFLGIPASMIYNFAAAALRAIGDTRRPLMYLSVSGIVNVLLNLVFVIVFNMGVAGVATATAISQVISASMIITYLIRSDNCLHLEIKKIRLNLKCLVEILKVGLPAGVQSTVFSVSNVVIQSSINSFGSTVMAANAAAFNLSSFISTTMTSIAQSALTFTSQNMGAKKYERIPRIFLCCSLLAVGVGMIMGSVNNIFGPWLLRLYTDDPEVIRYAMIRIARMDRYYFICGFMEVAACMLRGIGYSLTPMIITIMGACVFRIVWIYTVFAWHRTTEILYNSYPISWILTGAVHFILFLILWHRKMQMSDQRNLHA